MIKAIIFDITGVIFPYQPWIGQRPSREELLKIKKVAQDIYQGGKITRDFLKEELFKANRPKEELEAIYNSLTIIDGKVFNLIKELSKKYPLYIIANEASKWTDIRKSLYDFDKYFKKLYISCEIGLRKPDPEIFNLFLNESGFRPEECLFIDDGVDNIESARRLGFNGHVYHNPEDLKEYLDKMEPTN